jgi:hypothetical protein
VPLAALVNEATDTCGGCPLGAQRLSGPLLGGKADKVIGQSTTLSVNRGPDTVVHFILRMPNESSHHNAHVRDKAVTFSRGHGVAAARP